MKQPYTVVVLFALIIASSLTSFGSFHTTKRQVTEDMNRTEIDCSKYFDVERKDSK